MNIKCNKCMSTNKIRIVKDNRGLAVAYCSECNSRIKNMSMVEVMDYYENFVPTESKPEPKIEKPICKWCRENWFIGTGRMGSIYRPVPDIKYCPMCGRELLPTDKMY